MKRSCLSFKLLQLFAVLLFAAVFVTLASDEASAERIGSQSSPPDSGDWIINTTGNKIIDETVTFRIGTKGVKSGRS